MYAGIGTGGQFILVIPEAELVVVHRGDTDNGREVSGRDIWAIVELVLAARDGERKAAPSLMPMRTTALASQAPVRARPPYRGLTSSQIADYVGDYQMAPQVVARAFEFKQRLFMNFPGQGEAELIPVAPDEFTIMAVAGVTVRFERGVDGKVNAVTGKIGPQQFRGTRLGN
jgi:hypothetical protein